ncbi:MAG: methionine ABC transporter permease [Oscillospiraceae bacterium]
MQAAVAFFNPNSAKLLEGIRDTQYNTISSAALAYLIGIPLGVLLVITSRDSIRPMKAFHAILGWVINIGRSIPFIILMIAIIPFTRAIVGKYIGSTAAIVPLTIAAAPFIARLVESSLRELDFGIVEAAQSMGATNWQIIWKVLLPEAVPSLVRGFSISTITLIGYSAMAGAIGAGGLGDIAIRFGYNRYQNDVMIVTIILLILIVQVIQSLFNLLAKSIDRKNR